MLLQIPIGRETFSAPSGSCQINAFYRKRASADSVSVFTAMKDKHSGIQMVGREQFDASNYNKNHGQWSIARFQAEEGGFITLSIERRGGGAFNFEKAQLVLYLRETAALNRVAINLTSHPKAAQSVMYAEGRFDILKPEHFEEVGFTMDERYEDQYDSELWADLINVQVLERAVSPLGQTKKSQVKTKTGGVVVVKRKARRIVRLD